MNYSLNAGEWNSVFAVPSSVVDKYIKLASGNSLKLLLFLLRNGGTLFSDKELCDKLGFHREGELEDAALFWVQRGIIRAENGVLLPAREETAVQETLPEVASVQPEVKKRASGVKVVSSETAASYSTKYVSERISEDPEFNWLKEQAEALYGRLLRQPESQLLVMLVEHFGLPAQVSAMLLKYCFKIGKTSTSYIQTVAQTWSDEGVISVAEADERLSTLEKRFAFEEELRKAIDMKTAFSAKQLAFIKTWHEEWDFSLDMVLLAHEITINNTGSMRFSYTNKILENWHGAGIKTKEDVEKENAAFSANKGKGGSSDSPSSFNTNDIMNDILQKYKK